MLHNGYRTWATINLDSLRKNVKELKAKLSGVSSPVKILAVVKANAYGHGAKEISKILKSERSVILGVASIEEACELKTLRIPTIILSPVDVPNISILLKSNFIPTISDLSFARELDNAAYREKKLVKAYVEVDTGMIRTGIPWQRGVEVVTKLCELKNIRFEGIFTHFSEPENIDSEFTLLQLKRFKNVIKELRKKGINIPLVHSASSAAIMNFPASYFNMVRPGILLYGLYPSQKYRNTISIEPILNLYTKVCQVNEIPANTGVSYSRTYITKSRRKIATLLVGYGDGYPRTLSNKGAVLIKGRRAKIVGNICMDLTMIDVTNIPNVRIGDKVTLIGKDGKEEVTATEAAEFADTINYEITTRISPRVPRIYINNSKLYKVHSLLGESKLG